MAVSPEDLAAGALALQTFIKNAEYVEMVVGVAFGVIPSILGLGAAGLLASGISNTAKEVRNSISLLKTVGPGLLYGTAMAGKGLGKGLRIGLDKAAERWPSLTTWSATSWLFKPPKKKGGENQDTQGKQEEKGSGGSGGSPPPPPDIKVSDKKEERPKPTGIDTYSPIDELNPFKKKE
jgi:hypothetical protein